MSVVPFAMTAKLSNDELASDHGFREMIPREVASASVVP
jgi:hypothetical protein